MNKDNDQNRKQLLKYLTPHLEQFEKIDQWTDLGNQLQQTARYLENYPTQHIPKRKQLAKRLSQCLNGNLPIGIHRTTLNIYTLIFQNLKSDKKLMCEEIYIYAFGIFPFFTKSSIQVKPELIKIFKNYFLILGIEMIPMLTGLLGCLLPALEEQDDQLQKQVLFLFREINSIVGNKFFLSTLWLILLKNSKNRISCIKILNMKYKQLKEGRIDQKSIFKYELTDEDKQNPSLVELHESIKINNNSQISFFSNTQMIINSLSQCLQDEDILVKKNCLDFCINYMNFENQTLFDEEHLLHLYGSLITLLQKNDLSIIKRISRLIFQTGNLKNIDAEEKSYQIHLLQKSFSKLLGKCESKNQTDSPFRILSNIKLYNETIMQKILIYNSKLFFNFCFQNGHQINSEFNYLVLKEIKNFIKGNQSILEKVIKHFLDEILEIELFDKIEFLSFILKFIVLGEKFSLHIKIHYLQVLTTISVNLTKNFLKNCSSMENKQTEERIQNMQKEQILVHFTNGCVSQVYDILKNKNKSMLQENKEKFRLLQEDLLNSLKQFLSRQEQESSLMQQSFQKYIDTLYTLDILIKQDLPEEKIIELPNWLLYIFDLLNHPHDQLQHLVLKYLYKFCSIEDEKKTQNFLVQKYHEFIFNLKNLDNLYSKIIFQKILDLMEISNMKEICLNFYRKYVDNNINFVNIRIKEILRQENCANIHKIMKLWQYTSKDIHSNSMQVLEKSVFLMLSYSDSENPIVTNHLKNWLNDSEQNFQIIIDSIIKEIYLTTVWCIKEGKLMYNLAYDVDLFIKKLKNIQILLDYSSEIFVAFLENKQINSNFIEYNKEISFSMTNKFQDYKNQMEKEENQRTRYLFFIVKMLSRYFIGELNPDPNENTEEHATKVFSAKKYIGSLLTKILKNLKNKELIAFCSSQLIHFGYQNLQQSLQQPEVTPKLIYLNFISFLQFQTGLQTDTKNKENFLNIIKNVEYSQIIKNGLFCDFNFIIEEFNHFIAKMNIILNESITHPDLTKVIMQYLDGYLKSINYEKKSKSLKEQEKFKILTTVRLQGFKTFINYYLNDLSEEKINVQNSFVSLLTLGLSQGEEQIVLKFKRDKNTSQELVSKFDEIYELMLEIWNDIKIMPDFQLYSCYKKKTMKNKQVLELEGVSKEIISILKPLSFQFKSKSIETLFKFWEKNNKSISFKNYILADINYENVKIMEMILNQDLPPIEFLKEFDQTPRFKKLKKIIHKKSSSYKMVHPINKNGAILESNILSFLFCYLKYGHFKKDLEISLYTQVFQILKQFIQSFNPSTLMYIMDILALLLVKFDIPLQKFYQIKQKHQGFVAEIISQMIRILVNDHIIGYTNKQEEEFSVIFPLNPTSYNISSQNLNKLLKQKLEFVNEEQYIFDFQRFQQEGITNMRYRYFLIHNLQENFINLSNFYFNDGSKAVFSPSKLRPLFEKLFKLFDQRDKKDFLILNKVSLLLNTFIMKNKQVLHEYRAEILNIFQGDEFFNCNVEGLKIWSKILDQFLMETNSDILNKFFEQVNFSSMFWRKSTENKLRIKSFQRICFIIYSGESEKYVDKEKLKIFLAKIRQVLKEKDVHPNLIILIFFSLRILILRLRRETLDGLFKSMWPSILFLLEKMIKSKRYQKQKKHNEIIIASLKLLELISFTDIEEFNLHRWSFLYDFYGIKIKSSKTSEGIQSPFVIMPSLSLQLPEGTQVDYLGAQFKGMLNNNTRKIFLTQNSLQSGEMKDKIKEFLNYWVLLSSSDMKIDQEEMESLIQGDFINFKHFC